MQVSNNFKTLLGLSKEEFKVLEVLGETTLRTSDISHKVSVPRSTVERILENLHKRSLIKKHKYSARRGGWQAKTMEEIISPLLEENNKPTKEAYKVTHMVGFEAMKTFEYDFFKRYKNKAYYGIQGIRPWRAFHASFGIEEAHTINASLGKYNILADIVISKDTDKELLKRAYFDRPSLVHVIPNKFLPTAFDLEITKGEVVLMNWEKKRAISIQDEEVAQFFLHIYRYIKESADYFNVYKEIEGLHQ